MADQKISELTALTGANLADVDAFAVVDTSAVQTKKITYAELKTALDTGTGFVRITGDTMTGNLSFGDNNKVILGAGSDLQIYHTGSQSIISDVGGGNLNLEGESKIVLRSAGGTENYAQFFKDGAVELYHNNSVKFATTSTGIDVTGANSATVSIIAPTDNATLEIRGGNSDSGVEEANILFYQNNAAKWQLGNATDNAFKLYNYATSAYAVTIAADSDATFAGTVTATGMGIGTSSITSGFKMEVIGDARFGDAVGDDAVELGWSAGASQGFIQAYDRGASAFRSLNLNSSMTIDGSGTLFLGTTSPTLHSSMTGIVLDNGSLLNDTSRGASKSLTLAQNLAIDSGNTWAYLSTDEGSYYQQFNGNHYFGTAPSGTAGADATVTSKLTILNGGNVGIGTSSPNAKLEVSNITANDIPFIISGGTSSLGSLPETTGMLFGYGSGATYKKGAIIWEFTETNSRGKLHFCNDSNADSGNAQLSDSKMTIDKSGNVGIGTSSPSSYNSYANNLVVYEAGHGGITIATGTSNHASLYFADGTSGDTAYKGYLDYDHADDTLDIGTGGTHSVTIDSSGSVIIGDTDSDNAHANADNLVIGSTSGNNGLTIVSPTDAAGSIHWSDGTGSGNANIQGQLVYAHNDNSMRFYTAVGERMRIDSSGRVGIGTSVAPAQKLTVTGVSGANVGGLTSGILALTTGTGAIADTRLLFGIVDDSYAWLQAADYGVAYRDISLNPNGGNVGINTTNPQVKLQVNDSGTAAPTSGYGTGFNVARSDGLIGMTMGYTSANNSTYIQGRNFTNTDTQPITINPLGGGISFGTGNDFGSVTSFCTQSGKVASVYRDIEGNGNYIIFQNSSSTAVGSITRSSSSTVYATSSDYRLKENVADMTDATTRLKQLKPKRFNWIADDTNTLVDGFLAHEVSSVVPEAIVGTKDAVDADDNPVYQGIDQSKLVPLLIKTIQELEARITALES